jgi:3-hydroxyisobutyrate dehydrogenase-like beta-hydroxyacid dehydrogenase
VAASPEEAATAADITVTMLADPPAALAVAQEAAKGLSAGLTTCGAMHVKWRASPVMPGLASDKKGIVRRALDPQGLAWAGKGYIDASTVDAQTAQKIAQVRVEHLVVVF